MDIKRLTIRDVCFMGPNKEAAHIAFGQGLNVICGASETGKSFLVEAIDFLLGGSELKDIPERVGYDRARIAIQSYDERALTFERSVQGGNYRVFEGLIGSSTDTQPIATLKSKHVAGKDDNMSGWLLKQIDLQNKQLRTNQSGNTRSLSFRDLARLVIVNEAEVIRKDTPFLSGQYVTKTAEYSALKLVLTGVDDSAVVPIATRTSSQTGAQAKLELLDQWILEAEEETSQYGAKDDIEEQLAKLESSIDQQWTQLSDIQRQLNRAIGERRSTLIRKENINARMDEIRELLARFDLLKRHYATDINRLVAIEEAGSLFVHEEKVPCPLCGALPKDHHSDEDCEGDVELVVAAAAAEIEKIRELASDLDGTISALRSESTRLESELRNTERDLQNVNDIINQALSPDASHARDLYSEYIEKKTSASAALQSYERLDKLVRQKEEIIAEYDTESDQGGSEISTQLSKSVLAEFSDTVKRILQAWEFPGADTVYFDESAKDFVIDGKPRGSRGKGLRAITHTAATIGLLEFCQKRSLPHPGFVVIDSPLLAYYEPEGDDDSLEGTNLKLKFYKYLIEEHSDSQIIIIENQHPSDIFADQFLLTVFTKNPLEGRFGLFPVAGTA